MPSHTHLDLEELKRQAEINKKRKDFEKIVNDPNTVKPDDVMVILHREELETLEDILCDALKDKTLSKKQVRHVLNILKHIQEDEDNE